MGAGGVFFEIDDQLDEKAVELGSVPF